jgi:hypothetical protein
MFPRVPSARRAYSHPERTTARPEAKKHEENQNIRKSARGCDIFQQGRGVNNLKKKEMFIIPTISKKETKVTSNQEQIAGVKIYVL